MHVVGQKRKFKLLEYLVFEVGCTVSFVLM